MTHDPRFQLRAVAAAAMFAFALPAAAQLSSATVRGSVTAEAQGQSGVTVTATNTASGQVTRTASRADGSYVLIGLVPGTYRIDITAPGFAARSQLLTVQIGQTVDLDLPLAKAGVEQLQTVMVTGSAGLDRKTSELGTNVTLKQIDSLPQVTRNFLSFADLAPGVRFDVNGQGQVKVQSGAQNQDNINIFIDGVSQKNNILRGGASALDSTRGNPFPQSAIAEYKVISQNYKAEFDQVSSVAITAVTKSGGNELHGDVFWDHTGHNLTAYSPNESKNKDIGNDRAAFQQEQYGFTLGGPIRQDVAHWFFSYEGKNIESPRNVGFGGVKPPVPNAGLAAGFFALQGSHTQKFMEDLLFAKVDVELGPNQKLELTGRLRREKDHIAEDPTLSAPGNDKRRINDETRLDLKHEWSHDALLNEARIGYERYEWSPNADNKAPEIRYFISGDNTQNGRAEFLRTGGSPDAQDKKQTGVLLQDDLTYTGLAGHTMKGGAKVKFMSYDLSGANRGVDVFYKLINNQTGNPVLFGANDYFQLDAATTPTVLGYRNQQYGIYFQDDWAVTRQLELNLGIRWDYETNMLNNGYVTPADRIAALFAAEPVDASGKSTRVSGIPVTPGQTYDQSLAKGGINIRDYIANGSSRKSFTGAIQPRLGFSYDINGDKNLVAFAGVGRAYDRTIADYAIAEMSNNAAAKGDVYLIKNGYKMPYTDQLSLGLRKGVGIWNTEVGYTYSSSHNQFNWTEGNRDPQGGVGGKPPSDALFGGPTGFGNLVLGDFTARAKTQTVYGRADKPYTRASGWGAGVTYTYSDAKTTNANLTNDPYNFTGGRSVSRFIPSADVERHRLVASGVTDGLLPWGLLISGRATLGSGLPFRVTDCSQGFSTCVVTAGEGKSFRQFDLGIGEEFGTGFGSLSFRIDIINVFNTVNYTGGYDNFIPPEGNPRLGTPDGTSIGPMRTVKLSMRYQF
ncbi:MAG: TonB-dependent receptor [Pseudomonadota bacterium]|nr:TonB-dependent receptor [Pseudomonadota bacterium]